MKSSYTQWVCTGGITGEGSGGEIGTWEIQSPGLGLGAQLGALVLAGHRVDAPQSKNGKF